MDLLVADLNKNIDEEALEKLFNAFGLVERVKLIRDKKTGESKRFGFITLGSSVDAEAAILKLNGREIAGSIITVKKSTKDIKKKKRPRIISTNKEEVVSSSSYIKKEVLDSHSIKEVEDQTEFSTKRIEDGMVRIKFKK